LVCQGDQPERFTLYRFAVVVRHVVAQEADPSVIRTPAKDARYLRRKRDPSKGTLGTFWLLPRLFNASA